MKLEDYNCVMINIMSSIPYDDASWKRLIATFDRKKGTRAKKNSKLIRVRSILISADRKADYHYHFIADKSTDKNVKMINFEIGIHLSTPNFKRIAKKKGLPVIDLETLLSNLLGKKFENRTTSLNIDANFIFDRPAFESVLPVPFRSPFESLAGENILGEVSISGLKFKLEKSALGLKTVYFETFPKFIAIRSLFKQKIILNTKAVENFIKSAADTITLFVKKQEKRNVRKKS